MVTGRVDRGDVCELGCRSAVAAPVRALAGNVTDLRKFRGERKANRPLCELDRSVNMRVRHVSGLRNPVCIGVRSRRALLRAICVRWRQCAAAAGDQSHANYTDQLDNESHAAAGSDHKSEFTGNDAVDRYVATADREPATAIHGRAERQRQQWRGEVECAVRSIAGRGVAGG